jgi:Ca2+-binding RTX toxin-like protein
MAKNKGAPIYGDQNVNNTNDHIIGTNNSDSIFAYLGDDDVRGGNGNDTVEGGYGNDHLEGENGNDTLYGDNFTPYTATVVDPLTQSYDDFLDGGNGNGCALRPGR